MSFTVLCGELRVWEPARRVGEYFLSCIKQLEMIVDMESGITSPFADEINIDREKLTLFIDKIIELFETSNNTPLLAMISGAAEVLLAIESKLFGEKPRVGTGLRLAIIERSKRIFEKPETYFGVC